MEDFSKEVKRQLINIQNYKKINCDPTTVISTLTKWKYRWVIKTENPKTLNVYLKPEVHKEGNPGRPVISWIYCHTLKISEYVNYHFQPIVKEISSYVQDTTDFLMKNSQINLVPDNSYLVSLDVKLLYANIPNAEGIKSVKTSLEKYSERTTS